MKKVLLATLLIGVTSYLGAEIKKVNFSAINTKKGVFYVKTADFGKDYSKIIEREGLQPYKVNKGDNMSSLGVITIKCDTEKQECGYNLIKEYVEEHNKNFKPREEPKSMFGGSVYTR